MTVRYHLDLTDGDDAEIVAARLWIAGASGVQELPNALLAWFDTRVADVPPGGSWAQEPDQDWLASWRDSIRPVRIGRIEVVPSWLVDEHRPAPDAVVLELDPGVAFGSGHHVTTRLCLQVLQEELAAGQRVLDVGCGTGILAIAAALLGAGTVEAVDVDPDAVTTARRNAATNGVELAVHLGGVQRATERADVVLANLLTPTLHALAGPLVASVRPGGTLVASGVATERAAGVAAALTAAGAPAARRTDADGWSVLVHRTDATDAGTDVGTDARADATDGDDT